MIYSIILFLILLYFANCEDIIVNSDSTKDDTNINTNKRDWSELRNKVILALDSHNDCGKSCYHGQIERDLKAWEGKFNYELFQANKENYTYYQLIDNHLYRGGKCIFTMRCEGIEYFITGLIKEKLKKNPNAKLPNMEWLMNVHDYPKISHMGQKKAPPLFSFSRTPYYKDIMYPAWAFWKGGPCLAKVERQCLGRWDLKRKYMLAEENHIKFEDKKDIVFFRGSRTSNERDPLVKIGLKYPNKVDAKYVKNQAWRSNKDSMDLEPVEEVSLEDHCQYKYLFNFRGVAASFRHRHLFLCGSLVFHVGSDWLEFYYNEMKPYVHYIPILKNTEEDIETMIEFARDNPDLAQRIANNGHEFVKKHLRIRDVKNYWAKLLKSYYKMQQDANWPTIKLAENMKQIY